jgi:hypothetical protein
VLVDVWCVCLGSDGGEGRREVACKKLAIFLGSGPDLRFARFYTEARFLAIRRALEKLGLRTKVTGLF